MHRRRHEPRNERMQLRVLCVPRGVGGLVSTVCASFLGPLHAAWYRVLACGAMFAAVTRR
jgi:hypothetical protein